MSEVAPPFLDIRHIRKQYPGVLAVDDVSLSFDTGSIVGLVGKNGAIQPDQGQIDLDGTRLQLHHPHQATEAGLAFVHQDLYDVADLSVAENVMLGLGFPRKLGLFVDWHFVHRSPPPTR